MLKYITFPQIIIVQTLLNIKLASQHAGSLQYTIINFWYSFAPLQSQVTCITLIVSRFPTKTLYTPLLSPIRATCPAHLILLDFINRTILVEEYRTI
jgi:hypothetical protein